MTEPKSNSWFAAKRYRYGASLPIAWQGWAVLFVYIAVLILNLTINPSQSIKIGVTVFITAIFLIICAAKTEGGWHWRWGDRS